MIGFWKEQDELISTEANRKVGEPDLLLNYLTNSGKDFISAAMAIFVVKLLEIINIKEDGTDRFSLGSTSRKTESVNFDIFRCLFKVVLNK